eukprot:1377359-Prymnesium_polylepis.4
MPCLAQTPRPAERPPSGRVSCAEQMLQPPMSPALCASGANATNARAPPTCVAASTPHAT